jgi:hypothetical protein
MLTVRIDEEHSYLHSGLLGKPEGLHSWGQERLIRRSQHGALSISDGAIRDLYRALSEECGEIRKWNREPSVVHGVIRVRGGAISIGDGAIRVRCQALSAEHGAIRGQHRAQSKESGAIRTQRRASSVGHRVIYAGAELRCRERRDPGTAQGRKVSAYGAIRRPAQRVKRRARSNPRAAQSARCRGRSNPKAAQCKGIECGAIRRRAGVPSAEPRSDP